MAYGTVYEQRAKLRGPGSRTCTSAAASRPTDLRACAPGTYDEDVTITLNFEQYSWPEDALTVAAIMERKRWSFPLIIVKVNGTVVPRENWGVQSVKDGDAVEMYHLVSGG